MHTWWVLNLIPHPLPSLIKGGSTIWAKAETIIVQVQFPNTPYVQLPNTPQVYDFNLVFQGTDDVNHLNILNS